MSLTRFKTVSEFHLQKIYFGKYFASEVFRKLQEVNTLQTHNLIKNGIQ